MTENYTGEDRGFKSDIKIADDVIGYIAVLAASDVDGVAGMAGTATDDLAAVFRSKNIKKGIKTIVQDEDVRFSLAIIAEYGCNIPEVCRAVQDKVRTTVENMTGFTVSEVDVTIAGIKVPENV
jgi:uncharacterized alkaline shock family protein YloU